MSQMNAIAITPPSSPHLTHYSSSSKVVATTTTNSHYYPSPTAIFNVDDKEKSNNAFQQAFQQACQVPTYATPVLTTATTTPAATTMPTTTMMTHSISMDSLNQNDNDNDNNDDDEADIADNMLIDISATIQKHQNIKKNTMLIEFSNFWIGDSHDEHEHEQHQHQHQNTTTTIKQEDNTDDEMMMITEDVATTTTSATDDNETIMMDCRDDNGNNMMKKNGSSDEEPEIDEDAVCRDLDTFIENVRDYQKQNLHLGVKSETTEKLTQIIESCLVSTSSSSNPSKQQQVQQEQDPEEDRCSQDLDEFIENVRDYQKKQLNNNGNKSSEDNEKLTQIIEECLISSST